MSSYVRLHFKEHFGSKSCFGFIQVEATGSEKVANDAIHYVRRGGTLMIYGVYDNAALVHWAPSKIFGDEINVLILCGLWHILSNLMLWYSFRS